MSTSICGQVDLLKLLLDAGARIDKSVRKGTSVAERCIQICGLLESGKEVLDARDSRRPSMKAKDTARWPIGLCQKIARDCEIIQKQPQVQKAQSFMTLCCSGEPDASPVPGRSGGPDALPTPKGAPKALAPKASSGPKRMPFQTEVGDKRAERDHPPP